VWGNRNHRTRRIKICRCINIVPLHAQHKSPQMLDCTIAINKQDSRFASGHRVTDRVRIF
jgi:hypothetical protein